MKQMPLGFIPEPVVIAFDKLLPSRKAPDGLPISRKFKQIISSIDAIGLIEPLTIAKADKVSGMHLLLDGHIRMYALQELGFTDAPCLIAKDDESYMRLKRLRHEAHRFDARRAWQYTRLQPALGGSSMAPRCGPNQLLPPNDRSAPLHAHQTMTETAQAPPFDRVNHGFPPS